MEFEKLRGIIAEVLNYKPEQIQPETRFVEDLGADSLDMYQILMGIENAFEITVEDTMMEHIVTVEDAAGVIRSTLK